MPEPDWKAKYFALAEGLAVYQRAVLGVQAGRVDGGEYWAASNSLDHLLGEALSWRDYPEAYAEALARAPATPELGGE